MADRPIIFSAPMVRALLDGRKTQTRRVLKPLPRRTIFFDPKTAVLDQFQEPPYAPGDRLWVREAFSYELLDVDRNGFMPPWYWADGNPESGDFTRPKPSIHMPRWASRLTLLVTDVRVQRLQEISSADAIAEGCPPYANSATIDCDTPNPRDDFKRLWNGIHGPDAWDRNPWVAAISFKAHRCNIDTMEEGTRRSPASPPSGTPSPPSAPSPVRENSDE